jgi:hypothetical protein
MPGLVGDFQHAVAMLRDDSADRRDVFVEIDANVARVRQRNHFEVHLVAARDLEQPGQRGAAVLRGQGEEVRGHGQHARNRQPFNVCPPEVTFRVLFAPVRDELEQAERGNAAPLKRAPLGRDELAIGDVKLRGGRAAGNSGKQQECGEQTHRTSYLMKVLCAARWPSNSLSQRYHRCLSGI